MYLFIIIYIPSNPDVKIGQKVPPKIHWMIG